MSVPVALALDDHELSVHVQAALATPSWLSPTTPVRRKFILPLMSHQTQLWLASQGCCLSAGSLFTGFLHTWCIRRTAIVLGVQSDLDEAFSIYLQLSHLLNAASRRDLSIAKSWAASAENFKHDSALLAYKTALKFLDQHIALLSSSSRHFDVVREAVSSLVTDAFSCSVCHGALTTAMELVEQGRAVFWAQLACFSTPLDELFVSGDTGAALAEEFKLLSFHLLISRIRKLHGFSRFLLPPLFSDQQKVAEEGPVIIVNASRYSCDALIISNGQDPVHIPLDIAQTEVSELSSELQSLSEQFGSSDHQHKLVSILHKLWDYIVYRIAKPSRNGKFTLACISGGVLPLNSHCFLYTQQDPTRRRNIIYLTFTSPLTPPLWRHSFMRDSGFPGMRPCNILLPLVKLIRTEGRDSNVSLLS
ncbi:hypothetical protein EDB19DRAFT_1945192 [Suillus lakei]|nr:hypothetical protein EDB19DRAFT_1945192 [Suillus lakei]